MATVEETHLVPRIGTSISTTELQVILLSVVQKMGYDCATDDQTKVVEAFVFGKDVFVSLPTGSGKSLCYACLPHVFDALRCRVEETLIHHSIVVVVSPLSSLMQDQVKKYGSKGVKAAFVGKDQKDESIKEQVLKGEFELVFMSPESMLRVLKYREMFRSAVYQKNLMCLAIDEAHCVEKWGAKFRTEFANIAEIRALTPPGTNLIALTATANPRTRASVMKSLDMTNHTIVTKLPSNPNIFYAVLPMPSTPMLMLGPIIQEVSMKGTKADRTLIFCRSYDDVISLYQTMALELNSRCALYMGGKTKTSHHRLCDKYDACTALSVRKNIISSFTNPDGVMRVVFATIAFAMGLDSPNIRKVIHWKPPNDIEGYVQESGRGGRDGESTVAVLYYRKRDESSEQLSGEMKHYITNQEVCRRELLMSSFGDPSQASKPNELHLCCDICAKKCQCGHCIGVIESLELESVDLSEFAETESLSPPNPKQVLPKAIRDVIRQDLERFRYELCLQSPEPNAALIIGLELSTGLSDRLITHIVKQYNEIFVEQDLIDMGVPMAHANTILSILRSHLHS